MRNFRKLDVWKAGLILAKRAYECAALLPDEERYGLKSQMQRAAVSISANIAEGSSRISAKERGHYFRISLGSCFELETLIHLAMEIYPKAIAPPDLLDELGTQQKKLNSLIQLIASDK